MLYFCRDWRIFGAINLALVLDVAASLGLDHQGLILPG